MSRQTLWTLIVGVLLTAAVVAGAVFMLRTVNAPAPDPQAGTGEASTDEALTGETVARPDCPSTGAGGVELECLGGAQGAAPQSEGITVVNVWAWWCGPCREELPYFDELAAKHPEFHVVGVHADRNAANGAAMLEDLGVELPSYRDLDNTFAGTLGLPGVIPITVVFDGTEQIALFPRAFHSAEDLESAVVDAVERR